MIFPNSEKMEMSLESLRTVQDDISSKDNVNVRDLIETYVWKLLMKERTNRNNMVDKSELQDTRQMYGLIVEEGWRCAILGARKDDGRLALRAAMKVFALLAEELAQFGLERWIAEEVPKIICSAMKSFPGDRIIQREGFKAMTNLCCDPIARTGLVEHQGGTIATDALHSEKLTNDKFMVEPALGFVANLAHDYFDKAEREMDHFDELVDVILNLLDTYDESEPTQIRCLNALANLLHSATKAPADWDKEKRERFINSLLSVLRNNPDSLLIQQHGVQAMATSLQNAQRHKDKDFINLIFKHGGLITIKQAMWTFDVDPIIVKWSELAASILRNDEESKEAH